jgi:fructokinase
MEPESVVRQKSRKHSKIVVSAIGEILVDRFESGQTTLGGAPFNVAFHLHQLLAAFGRGSAMMVSAVGEDDWGRYILSGLKRARMERAFLSIDEEHPTGSAIVFMEAAGQAGFEIAPDVAWDYLSSSPALEVLAKRSQAVIFGSLGQRSLMSREAIRTFVAKVTEERLYDVNLRRNSTDGIRGYSHEIVSESLELATVIKLNDHELEELAIMLPLHSAEFRAEERRWDLMQQLRDRFNLKAVALTRGPKGALLLGEGQRLQLEDSKLKQETVHPVGAGDSFAAGLLFGVVHGWSLNHSLRLAAILSEWVVRHVSATPTLTSEIISRVRELIDEAGGETVV